MCFHAEYLLEYFSLISDSCDDAYHVMSVLMHELKDQRTVAVIGSTEPFLCETISKIADANQKPFIAWNCPQVGNPPKQDKFIRSGKVFISDFIKTINVVVNGTLI